MQSFRELQTMSRALAFIALGMLASAAAGSEPQNQTPAVGRMVHYSGQVQGVGFRAATAAIAKKRPVTGWVKNLPDGRVQLLVEGAEPEVEAFLKAVRSRWKGNIEKEQVEKRAASGKYKTFEIVR